MNSNIEESIDISQPNQAAGNSVPVEKIRQPRSENMGMTSRERVISSINHQQPDKMAVDFGGTTCSSMAAVILSQLRDFYGLPKRPVEIMDVYTMVGIIDEELQDKLGTDAVLTLPLSTAHGFHRDHLKRLSLIHI